MNPNDMDRKIGREKFLFHQWNELIMDIFWLEYFKIWT